MCGLVNVETKFDCIALIQCSYNYCHSAIHQEGSQYNGIPLASHCWPLRPMIDSVIVCTAKKHFIVHKYELKCNQITINRGISEIIILGLMYACDWSHYTLKKKTEKGMNMKSNKMKLCVGIGII